MKKIYKIVLLLTVLIFLSTFNPNKSAHISKTTKEFFDVENIEITNNYLIKKKDLYEKLKKVYGKNILFLSKKEVTDPILNIKFLEKIEVKKKYPNTVIIKVFETHPVGILFKNKTKYLLDSSSNLILYEDNENYDKLPKIFGEGAEKNFVIFYKKLKKNNFPEKEIKNYYYFPVGRWDLELKNNKTIKFPEKTGKQIIDKSIKLMKRKDFDTYKIIDLRVKGKIIVE